MEIYKKWGDLNSEYIAIKKRSFAKVICINSSASTTLPICYFKNNYAKQKKLYKCQITHDEYKKLKNYISEGKIIFSSSNDDKNIISKRIYNYIKPNDILVLFNIKEQEPIVFKINTINNIKCIFEKTNKYINIKSILNYAKKIQERKLPIYGKSNN